MSKEKNVPRLRFPGFTDDWEQRKLSECAGFRRGSFPQPYGNKEWYDGEGAKPFVQVADVSDDMILVDDTKQKISKLAQPMSVYADKGSVLVTLQGSIGRVAITQYGAFVDRTVLIFDKYNQDIDKTFWAYIIKEKFIDEARKAPGGTIKTITKEALSDFDLMLPNYDEQKKLGAFLVSIDNLITLHQRKCINNTIKHINDWEQRKLGDLAASFEYGLNAAAKEYDGTNKYIRITDIDDESREFNIENLTSPDFDLSNADNYKLTKGDILFARTGASVGKTYIYRESDGLVYYAGFLIRAKIKEDYDSEFVFQSTLTNQYEKFINVTSMRSGQPGVNAQEYSQYEIMVPQKAEQKKIAAYLRNIDNLITLHQRKWNEMIKNSENDWEQRKLVDYLEVSSEKNRDNRFTKEDVLSVSGEYGIVNQIEFQGRSFAGASVSNYGVVENGDVVYTKSPLKSNPYGIIKTNKGIPGIVSTLYAVYKPKEITDSKFVQIYFELDSRMNSYMHPLVNKGAKNDMKVSAENALKGMVSFPKKNEQEMISLYFSTLDHLITLHQR